jgi:hypothetical protein
MHGLGDCEDLMEEEEYGGFSEERAEDVEEGGVVYCLVVYLVYIFIC